MTNCRRTLIIFGIAILASCILTLGQAAKDTNQAAQTQQQPASLASKLLQPTKARSSRSLSDMFEKVKSKIFGSKKQSASSANANSQIQAASSANAAQRQPWGDYSRFSNNYQWPSSSGNQYLSQSYSPLGAGYPLGAQAGPGGYSPLGASVQSQPSPNGMEGAMQQQVASSSSLNSATNSNSASNGGLLSSASHLIAQYLSPNSVGVGAASGAQPGSQQLGPNGQTQNMMNPQQQQQQQSQYNEFASILDSMVAQTGVTNQRQPAMNQYMGPGGQNQATSQQGAYQPQQGYQPAPGNMIAGDQDMSASNNVQSYMPTSQQAASQKSSMVSLAEQLAPGAQFNKLVSFPFSLSNNDDPNKEGRYKLHIPFLNQHVKRSDQQNQANSAAANQARLQQQQQQQYVNSYLNPQQLMSQASQVAPTIVSPQSSVSQSSSIQSAPVSSSSSVSVSQSSSMLSPNNSPNGVANSRPNWSVADIQSGASSSKLIPMQSAASQPSPSSSVSSSSSSSSSVSSSSSSNVDSISQN